jgi:lipoprotein-releasing system ATP-binding protein
MLILQNITKKFSENGNSIEILKDVNLSIKKGEIVSLIGESGSGKSSLLHVAGLISSINPEDSGSIIINDIDCTKMSDDQRSEMRKKIGFIYQFHHLMHEFTAFENILLPQIILGIDENIAISKTEQALKRFNLLHLKNKKPQYMSGGENQRIAILRAFIKEPLLVLADEPTGNLDEKNAYEIFDFILQNSKEKNITCLIISHNSTLAQKTDRMILMNDINKNKI